MMFKDIPFETKIIIKRESFVRSIIIFLKTRDEVNPEILLEKLKLKAENIKACTTRSSYQMQLKEIFMFFLMQIV